MVVSGAIEISESKKEQSKFTLRFSTSCHRVCRVSRMCCVCMTLLFALIPHQISPKLNLLKFIVIACFGWRRRRHRPTKLFSLFTRTRSRTIEYKLFSHNIWVLELLVHSVHRKMSCITSYFGQVDTRIKVFEFAHTHGAQCSWSSLRHIVWLRIIWCADRPAHSNSVCVCAVCTRAQ